MRKDATRKTGLIVYEKCAAAMRQIAYGTCLDAVYDYVRMGGSAVRECLKEFCRGVVSLYKNVRKSSNCNRN